MTAFVQTKISTDAQNDSLTQKTNVKYYKNQFKVAKIINWAQRLAYDYKLISISIKSVENELLKVKTSKKLHFSAKTGQINQKGWIGQKNIMSKLSIFFQIKNFRKKEKILI